MSVGASMCIKKETMIHRSNQEAEMLEQSTSAICLEEHRTQ